MDASSMGEAIGRGVADAADMTNNKQSTQRAAQIPKLVENYGGDRDPESF